MRDATDYTDEIVDFRVHEREFDEADLELGRHRVVGTSITEAVRQRAAEPTPRFVVRRHEKILGRRGSGKVFSAWRCVETLSLRRTQSGLVTMLTFNRSTGSHTTSHIFASAQIPAIITQRNRLDEVIGEIPKWGETFPLLAGRAQATAAPWEVLHPFVHAEDSATVARAMYGVGNYRRPLAAELADVGKHQMLRHTYLLPFRGLVPIDWVIDAYRGQARFDSSLSPVQMLSWRVILKHLSQADRRRMLREIATGHETSQLILGDILRVDRSLIAKAVSDEMPRVRDLDSLHLLLIQRQQAAEADGFRTPRQRRVERAIRSHNLLSRENQAPAKAAHEDQIGRALTWDEWEEARREAKRAEQDERERQRREKWERENAEKAAWHNETCRRIETLDVPGLSFVIGRSATQLSAWSQEMGNCISRYASKLQSEVLLGVERDGNLLANLQITDRGIAQILGRYNRDLSREDFDQITEHLATCGILLAPRCWGVPAREEVGAY